MERRLSVRARRGRAGRRARVASARIEERRPDDLRAAAADLDASDSRERGAAVQARADTLAQLPRLGWAVATDENTMRDLTTEELAFRPHPGEHIEITQVRRGGGEPRRLLRLPAEGDVALPVLRRDAPRRAGEPAAPRHGRQHRAAPARRRAGRRPRGREAAGHVGDRAAPGGARDQRRAAHHRRVRSRWPAPLPADRRSRTTIPLARPAGAGAAIVAANVRPGAMATGRRRCSCWWLRWPARRCCGAAAPTRRAAVSDPYAQPVRSPPPRSPSTARSPSAPRRTDDPTAVCRRRAHVRSCPPAMTGAASHAT